MKFLKKYKIFETGEWARDVDWQFVKDNPDDDSEEANYIKIMEKYLNEIKEQVDNEDGIEFEIINIKGIDLYQGAVGSININKNIYKIFFSEENLWIENFPIDNTSKNGELAGFEGCIDEIVEAIIDHYKPINKELRKYNI